MTKEKKKKKSEFGIHDSLTLFEDSLRHSYRFLQDESVHRFLSCLTDSIESRIVTYEIGTHYWRALLAYEEPVAEYPTDEGSVKEAQMNAFAENAREGLVSPPGIACLYVSSDLATAIAEVHPQLGARVTVAKIITTGPIKLVNCRIDPAINAPKPGSRGRSKRPSSRWREGNSWQEISEVFLNAPTDEPSEVDYVLTQVLAEHFRRLGFDGIEYSSALGPGAIVALFNLSAAEIIDISSTEIRQIECSFDEPRWNLPAK